MKKSSLNKGIICVITMLFFGAGVFPIAVGENVENYCSTIYNPYPVDFGRGILYVGGGGPGNHSTIQEALQNASNDDIIFVYSGTYNENLNILKRITLTGEDRDTTIIQGVTGDDNVISITHNDVTISGFTIKGDSTSQDGITVITLFKDITISTNKINNCGNGIRLQITTQRVTISDNIISNNEFSGILLQGSDLNDIVGNSIESNGDWGISFPAVSKQNNVSDNDVIGNYGGISFTTNSAQNEVVGNNIQNNDREGIVLETLSNSNTIINNDITNNYVGIKLTSSGQNIIENNNIQDNDLEGLFLENSNNNQIERNNFIGNQKNAVYRVSRRNVWDENYWDNWIGLKISFFQFLPKVIRGGIIFVNLDQNPALEPYVI